VLPETSEEGNRSSYYKVTDQNPEEGSVNVCLANPDQQDPTITPDELKPFDLVVDVYTPSASQDLVYYLWKSELPDEVSNLSGYLTIRDSVNEEVSPGTVPLQLSRPAPGYGGGTFTFIIGSAIVWFVLMTVLGLLITKFFAGGRPDGLGEYLGLQVKTGSAANLTTAGAILGTFLSAQVLPNDTFFISKEQYITLNLIFGLVFLFSSALHNNIPYGLMFLISSAAILGAGLGELATVCLLVQEIAFQGSMPASFVGPIQLTLVLVSFIMTVVAGYRALSDIWDEEVTERGTI
jgi:hypothetical protein